MNLNYEEDREALKDDISIISIGEKLFNNRYEIVDILGRGGFGIVYLVKDLNNFNLFALKELFITNHNICHRTRDNLVSTKNPPFFKKFKKKIEQEVKILEEINNPNVIKIYGSFEENNTIYILMEYLNGEDLKNEGIFTEKEIINLFKQLFNALKEFHNRKNSLIHRDIKPSNIIKLKGTSLYKLIDFTNIKSFRKEEEIAITQVRTPSFAPPELKKTKAEIGTFSDIYSIGMTFYSLLSGMKTPPSDEDRIIHKKQLEIEKLKVSQQLKNILIKMTEIKPEDRYQSLEEIMKDIEKIDDRKQEFLLKINTTSPYFKIKILNSSKKYHDNIKLRKGIYQLEITSKGYKKKVVSVTLNKNLELDVNLEKNILKIFFDYIYSIFSSLNLSNPFEFMTHLFFSLKKYILIFLGIGISVVTLSLIADLFATSSPSLCDTPEKMKICEERYINIFEKDSTLINNFDEFKELVEAGVDIKKLRTPIPDGKNKFHIGGETALHHLTFKGKYDFVKFLVEEGGAEMINIQDFKGNTALYEAIAYYKKHELESEKIIKLLLDKGADISLRDSFSPNASPLSVAVKLKLIYPIKELVNAGICQYEKGRKYDGKTIYDILNKVSKGHEGKAKTIKLMLEDNGC